MAISRTNGRAVLRVALLLVAFIVTGCSGMQPFEPRDERTQGPEQGLFSGEAGEFVIYSGKKQKEADQEVPSKSK